MPTRESESAQASSAEKSLSTTHGLDVTSLLSGAGGAIPLFKVHLPNTVLEPLGQCLLSGYIGQGPRVVQFEQELAGWFGNKNVLALNSGTSALHLALRLANVGAGDEVISTAMTCTATNMPILAAGAHIVWADIDDLTGNIDPLDVERKITARTKAIIAVHWGGYPCDLAKLNRLARKYGVRLIEDAAHAFGATYQGAAIGSHSDFVCFSFQAIKQLTTVDGGALVCRTTEDYKRGKLLRWYGIDRESERRDFRCEEDIAEYGYKFHMNDVNATIGLEQLKYVAEILRRQRDNAAFYRQALRNVPGVTLMRCEEDRLGSYWLFTVRVPDRQRFMEDMKRAGVVVSQVHARNDKHTAFAEFRRNLPRLDVFAAEHVCIPVGWWLSDSDRQYIAKTIAGSCG